jgi:hypothetical protein
MANKFRKYFQKVIGSFLCNQTEAQSIYIYGGVLALMVKVHQLV